MRRLVVFSVILLLVIGTGIFLLVKENTPGQNQITSNGTLTPTPQSQPQATPAPELSPQNSTTSAVPTQHTISIYFPTKKTAQHDCSMVRSVSRTIPATSEVARQAINQLLQGPTAEEIKQGYLTQIPSGTKLQRLVIENGTARADFSSELDKNVAGSCRVTAIRAQITQALLQFPTIKSVVISIDGRTEDILQP